MFLPDKTRKTVRILVRVKAGNIVRINGTPLPKIKDGAVGDLVLPASDLLVEAERQALEAESSKELLPAGTSVFVGLNPTGMTKKGQEGRLALASELKIIADPEAPKTALGI